VVGVGAKELSALAEAVHNNDLNGLVDRMRGLARRQPAVFAGAAVAIGFALARVARIALDQPSSSVDSPASGPSYRASPVSGGFEGNTIEVQTTETDQRTDRSAVPPATTFPGTTYNG
jgi:hypothetical protein